MNKISLRTATIKDVPGIVHVRMLTWYDTYPNKKYRITRKNLEDMDMGGPKAVNKICRRVKNIGPNLHLWVALDKGRVIGYCTVFRKPTKNYLGSFYILPAYQGHGLGTKLIKRALKWFGQNAKVELGVASYSRKTIRFYKKFGFINTGPNLDSPKLPDGRRMPSIKMIRCPN